MVKFEEDVITQTCLCTSDKNVKPVRIQKSSDGYIFFEVVFEGSKTPKELSGKFSSMQSAKRCVAEYFRKKPATVAGKYKARHSGSELNAEGS